MEALAEKHGLSCPIAIDNETGDTCNSYGVRFFPNSVLVGRDGQIISGQVNYDDLLIRVR